MQGGVQHILEIFCTGKQNYEREMDSGLALVHKEDIMVDLDESNIILELTQIRKFMISYRKQTEYLHEMNENLMLLNKRLWEDLEREWGWLSEIG